MGCMLTALFRGGDKTMLSIELDVRAINKAVDKNFYSGGGGVYCDLADGSRCRVSGAKSARGQVFVKRLNDGHWVSPMAAYKEW